MAITLKDHNKTAIIIKDEKISYKKLIEETGFYTTLFKIKPQQRVILFAENKLQWIYAFYSTWYNKGITVPLDSGMPLEEVKFILKDNKPSLIFCSNKTEKITKKAVGKKRIKIINLDKIKKPAKNKVTPLPDISKISNKETAVIIYTSGTTGNPKGVMLSFTNLIANMKGIEKAGNIIASDKTLCLLPFHHILPLQGNILMIFYLGGTTVIIEKLEKELIFEELKKNKITLLVGVPRLYTLFHKGMMDQINKKLIARLLLKLMKIIKSIKLSQIIFKKVYNAFGGHLRECVSGGAKIDPQIIIDFLAVGILITEGYGTSETAPIISFNPLTKFKIGSVGKVIPGMEAKIVNNEILVKGTNVMQGYYNNPEATKKVLKNGWYHTGDYGSIDKNGFITITGRKDEMIVLTNGKNINPEEIEKKIAFSSPYIKEIGILNYNNLLTAIISPDITLFKNKKFNEIIEIIRTEVIDKYNDSVANYKKILKLRFVESELPRTRLGKLKRFMLTEMIKTAPKKTAKKDVPNFTEYKIVSQFINKLKETTTNPSDHIEYDLAFDSLDKVELLTFLLKTFGITIGEEDLNKNATIIKISTLAKKQKTKIEKSETNWKTILDEEIDFKATKKIKRYPLKKTLLRFCKKRFNLQYSGIGNLPKEPFIIAPNHESYLDAIILTAILPEKIIFNTYFLVKDSKFMARIVKLFTRGRNVILVNEEKGIADSLQKSAVVLKNNRNIIIFPEGTRTLSGKIGEFKKSFAILSKELNLPIVPVAISGAFEALSMGKKIPSKGNITITILPPVNPNKKSYLEIRDIVKKKITASIKKTKKK